MTEKDMDKKVYEQFQVTSYLSGGNAPYVEDLYENFLKDPTSVDQQWRHYFESLSNGTGMSDVSHQEIREHFKALSRQPKNYVTATPSAEKQEYVDGLIAAYRCFGHLHANIDPLGIKKSIDVRLTLAHHHLSESDYASEYNPRGLLDKTVATLKDIHETLQRNYCGSIGVECSRISNEEERHWLRDYAEKKLPTITHSVDVKKNILNKLIGAAGWEKYLETKYPGQKRFSVEGGDSIIPLLDELARRARSCDVKELVIGMAHRGRLNVLVNTMGKPTGEIFQEFEGIKSYGLTTGDVKYHYGFSSDIQTDAGPVHLSLAFNPSHLEFINAVVMGSVRARQERNAEKTKRNHAMAVVIHGDGAFAGQGVVMETLNMSQTRAYHIGGSVHIILNNQVGFTTSNPKDTRSSHYCSDLAKMIDAPVFHVNGDDPEAVVAVTQLALEYRLKFHKDIVIDLVCYRRHGHQEVDEPRATQPLMYKIIDKLKVPYEIYADKLIAENVVTQAEVDQMREEYRSRLDKGQQVIETLSEGLSDHYAANWTPFLEQEWRTAADTSISKDRLLELGEKLVTLPEGFSLQRNVNMIYSARQKMVAGEQLIDWGFAENMAYASLLDEGYPVRFSGEDVRRGTFFHRHAYFFDQNTGQEYMPLAHLREGQPHVQLYDSLLSEAGPMGFEYGYSTADPHALVIWEAQFGDFANGGQVIVDQFMSSAWQKWNRLAGLVMLLPHGNEGMGPEHSSARLERYLQLCAQDNMQVFVPTTPSQIFHLLRRQVIRPYRKPLIVMSPKSLLRHKLAVSNLDDLSEGQLQLLIPEIDAIDPAKVTRLVITYGKIYYELLQKRRDEGIDDIAIVRIEQLYPFPYEELAVEFERYKHIKEVVWCQEEPKNQGAWFCTHDRLNKCVPNGLNVELVSRKPMAAPASGYPAYFKKTQQEIVHKALRLPVAE